MKKAVENDQTERGKAQEQSRKEKTQQEQQRERTHHTGTATLDPVVGQPGRGKEEGEKEHDDTDHAHEHKDPKAPEKTTPPSR